MLRTYLYNRNILLRQIAKCEYCLVINGSSPEIVLLRILRDQLGCKKACDLNTEHGTWDMKSIIYLKQSSSIPESIYKRR